MIFFCESYDSNSLVLPVGFSYFECVNYGMMMIMMGFLNKLPRKLGILMVTIGVLLFYPFMTYVVFGLLALFTNDVMTGERYVLMLLEAFFVQLLIFHISGILLIILGTVRLRKD